MTKMPYIERSECFACHGTGKFEPGADEDRPALTCAECDGKGWLEPAPEGLLLRTARKRWNCAGSGGRPNRHAPDCPGVIEPGEQYVECLWEAPAYQSGTRHAIVCARETHGWR